MLRRLARRVLPGMVRGWILRRAPSLRPVTEPPPFAYPFLMLLNAQRKSRPPFRWREHYRWGVYCAALTARTLGYARISVVEFGVAGGNGLVALEDAAEDAENRSGVTVEVYGFDTGKGLPKPQDYRDLPHLWREGDYKMDVTKLRSRLRRAELVLGPVAETVPQLLEREPAPLGFAAFDVDMYSSTMDAFRWFTADHRMFLPRVVCYFDDIIGYSYSDFTGERAAIADFNESHDMRKISPLYGLSAFLGQRYWTQLMYMFHAFDHPRHADWDGTNCRPELPLEDDR